MLFEPLGEAHFAASIEATTPAMMTVLLLAERFRLDSAAAALLIGWSTILFWLTLPLTLALGLVR
jgi:predicted permease